MGVRQRSLSVLRPDGSGRPDSGVLRGPGVPGCYDAPMRKPVNARTAKPVRVWEADAEWLRETAFRRRVPQAVVAAEAFELYRRSIEGA